MIILKEDIETTMFAPCGMPAAKYRVWLQFRADLLRSSESGRGLEV